jgi:Ala-tRNA(Pro) deacylase
MKILDYLSGQNVDFTVKHHELRYTAQQEAQAQHLSGHIFAKTVIVHANGEYVLLVLPASCRVNLKAVEALLGAEPRMASEEELAELFPDCDLGAEPPFGSRYGLRSYVDEHLTAHESIAIRAGSHKEVVLLRYVDWARLERPQVGAFGTPGA